MINKFLNLSDSSASWQQPIMQATSNKQFRKKLFVTFTAITIITAAIAAIFLRPNGETEIILSAIYAPGEKLTYDITMTSTSQIGNSSTSSTIQRTLAVEVLNIKEDTYNLRYTTTPSIADNSSTTSYLMNVKKTDMTSLFTLLPVAFQQFPEYTEYTKKTTISSPLETAFFNQSKAKVGDTWKIPVINNVSTESDAEITVKFVSIETLDVEAGTFKVFKIEFTRNSPQQKQAQFGDYSVSIAISGETYLEVDSCKIIKGTVQFNMTSIDKYSGHKSFVTTISSTLKTN
jgi:hypothetical protein